MRMDNSVGFEIHFELNLQSFYPSFSSSLYKGFQLCGHKFINNLDGLDSNIQWIDLCPRDGSVGFGCSYPVDRD